MPNSPTSIESPARQDAHVRRLERLLEASRLLNSTLELHEITQIVLRIVQEEVPMDRCTLFVVDRNQNLLRSFYAQGVGKFEITLPIGQGLAGTVAATGETLDIADVYEDCRFEANFDDHLEYRTKDAVCMPVFNCDATLIGVLQLLNRQRPLQAEDKEFLSSICTYIGLALNNAWIHRELQESRNLEQEMQAIRETLAQSEKRSAVSELVTGIIHEMRNPLSIALGQCALLKESSGEEAPSVERISKIETSINAALKVAKNFLSFAREGAKDHVPADINTIINQTVDLTAYDLRTNNISVVRELQTVPLVRLDPGNIQQVLLNLLRNAQQAARGTNGNHGTVLIRTWFDQARSAVQIAVTDDGAGIPEEIQARIFEPFFTTRERGAGTGLGLAVSKRIIEQHRGTLSFKSKPGEGTTFQIELPARSTQ
jgi:signal transduction histidine kinase